jgi:hypothetical protein
VAAFFDSAAEKQMADRPLPDEELDLLLEQIFPASDPPCFMAGAAIVGSPHNVPPSSRSPTLDGVSAQAARGKRVSDL